MNPKNIRPSRVAHPGLALALGLALVATPAAHAINAIVNDNFTGGSDPWTLKLASGYQAELDAQYGWGRVRITDGGTSRAHVNLDQPLGRPLINNVEYTIEFDAKADVAKSIDILIRNNAGILHGTYNHGVGTSATRKTIHFLYQGPDVHDARLSFRVGGNNTTVYIDNVVVTRKGEASTLITKTGQIPTQWNPWQFPTITVPIKGVSTPISLGTFDFSYAGYNYGERESFIQIPTAPNRTHTIQANPNAVPPEDITDKINTALAAIATASTPTTTNPNPTVGGTVFIPAGTYRIGAGKTGNAITVSTHNTVIKGAGMGVTILNIDGTYDVGGSTPRKSAHFDRAVINFRKENSPTQPTFNGGGWRYNHNNSTVTAPVSLGAREITVADASLFPKDSTVVIRQYMWESFVETHSYDPTNDDGEFLRWTNYKNGEPDFTDGGYAFVYYRKVTDSDTDTNTLQLDIPIPRRLDPADNTVTIGLLMDRYLSLVNCGMQDLTITAAPEADITPAQESVGTTIAVTGVYNGLFKNIDLDGFRSLGFVTTYAVNTSFINCTASNALNRGEGGTGYGFYIRGQNLLYKNCNAINVRHGFTTATASTSNLVIKNCSGIDFGANTGINSVEAVDDTHLGYAHGILWDNHYSREAGLLMINRGQLSDDAYETCGWGIVWNYENEGIDTKGPGARDWRRNLIGITPEQFGLVIGAHAGAGPDGIRIRDGYSRLSGTNMGNEVTNTTRHVGTTADRVLYEHVRKPVAESIYDIQFAQRPKFLNAP